MENNPRKPEEGGQDMHTETGTETHETGTMSPETQPSESNTPQSAPSETAKGGGTNSKLVYAVIVAVVAAILVGAYVYITKSGSPDGTNNLGTANQGATSTDLVELLDLTQTDPVATVNGETLSWQDYKQSLNEVVQNASNSGVDVSNPETQTQIKQQALTSLVNTELLLQAAQDQGIAADDSEVQSEYEHIQGQLGGEAELDRMLAQFELTRDDLRTSIAEQIAINDYISGEVNTSTIEVSEEEVQTLYDQASAGAQEGQQLPPLEQVRASIESQIRSSKQQQLVASLIETLRETAEIETML